MDQILLMNQLSNHHSRKCSTTGVTKNLVCTILSVSKVEVYPTVNTAFYKILDDTGVISERTCCGQ